jgi:hypothetical protein
MRVIESDDDVELLYLTAVADEVDRRRTAERKLLAVEIINTLARSLK